MALQDSGERREFSTGAVRDMSAGKGRYDLIPYDALRRLALIYEHGAVKYGEGNWMKGIPVSSFIDSAMRHLQKFSAGLEDEDHPAQAVWNIFAAMWTIDQIRQGKLSADLDNRAYKIPVVSIPTVWTAGSSPQEGDTYVIVTNDPHGGPEKKYLFRNGNWEYVV
jgi:hypothetical protein